jgi:hypothetical protein
VVETDVADCFGSIPHSGLMSAVEERVGDRRLLALLRAFLRAGVMEQGSARRPVSGTPQGGVVTPPTQWATRVLVTLRVGTLEVLSAVGGPFPGGDAVPDGDLLGSDEDVFDEQPQHALAFLDAGELGLVAELGEESFQVVGEFEIDLAVRELRVDAVELAAQVWHAGSQFVDADQLFLECLDQSG